MKRSPRPCAPARAAFALAHIDTAGLPVRIGGAIDGFEPRDYIDKKDRKQLKMMVRTIQLAVAGARLALRDAALEAGKYDPERLGIVMGTGTIPGELADLGPAAQTSYDPATRRVDLQRSGAGGIPAIPPTWMLNHVPNMPACHAAILNDARGPNNTITQSDVAGVLAIGEACRMLRGGRADLMLAGGADTRINAMTLVRYYRFSQLSTCNDAPPAPAGRSIRSATARCSAKERALCSWRRSRMPAPVAPTSMPRCSASRRASIVAARATAWRG